MKRAGMILAASVVLTMALAVALAHPPTAAPASNTATAAAVDMSSPKATLHTVYKAMRNGDIPTIRQCMIFEQAQEAELFDIELTRIWGPLKLMRALEAKFGEAAKKPFGGETLEKELDLMIARVEKVEITVNGETATLDEKKAEVNPDAETELTGVTLKKQEGKWKIVAESFSDMGSRVKPEELKAMRASRDAVATACEKTLVRVKAGEFKSVDEAFAAYQEALQEAARSGVGKEKGP